ncbi:hypothetical protein AAVH_21781 [Aphelenchoides avenae]|nr:hypothetical protein AAVH_21781 [Aphelenchus avenae]
MVDEVEHAMLCQLLLERSAVKVNAIDTETASAYKQKVLRQLHDHSTSIYADSITRTGNILLMLNDIEARSLPTGRDIALTILALRTSAIGDLMSAQLLTGSIFELPWFKDGAPCEFSAQDVGLLLVEDDKIIVIKQKFPLCINRVAAGSFVAEFVRAALVALLRSFGCPQS